MYVKYSSIPVFITPAISDTVESFSTTLSLDQADVMSSMHFADSETDDSIEDDGKRCLLDKNGKGGGGSCYGKKKS